MTEAIVDTEFSKRVLRGRDPKKTVVILIRWVLIVSCSCLILFSKNSARLQALSHLLILFLIFSNLILASLPDRIFKSRYFDPCLVTFDIVLITACIWSSGQVYGDLYLLYFLIIMIAALSETFRANVWSAFLVSVVYAAVMVGIGGLQHLIRPEILVRIPFFFVVVLFYGYFAQRVRFERSKKAEFQKKLSVAKRVRETSGLLTQSLDRRTILENLAESSRVFCEVRYSAVVSRGGEKILAESGDSGISPKSKRCSLLLAELARRPNVDVDTPMEAMANTLEDQKNLAENPPPSRVFFSSEQFSFLPLNGKIDSDLYLSLMGSFDGESLEYLGLLLISASMALSKAGQYQELVHEVEKRKEVVERLSSVLKFKSEFVANITHEIRTPIHSFIGFSELLLADGYGSLAGDQRRVINRMLENAQSLLVLVNNILDNAQLEAGEYKIRCVPGEIAEFIDDVVETCAPLIKDKAVSLNVSSEKNIPTVITDWNILRHVVLNLVSNALKFTPQGRVDVSAGFSAREEQLSISVRDTGIGVSSADISQIFEPFRQLDNSYTKKYAGTGLGLAITKKQVELLGGMIRVDSKPNYGSLFTVLLPVKATKRALDGSPAIATVTGEKPLSMPPPVV